MKTNYLLKVGFLVLALIGVVVVMRLVTPERMQSLMGAMAGETTTFNLCETRVHALIFPDGKKIEEYKSGMEMKWLAHDPVAREINYLEVEKWLGKYCRLAVEPTEAIASGLQSVVIVEYINGQSKAISGAPGAVFSAGTQTFRSQEFESALAELRRLAQF